MDVVVELETKTFEKGTYFYRGTTLDKSDKPIPQNSVPPKTDDEIKGRKHWNGSYYADDKKRASEYAPVDTVKGEKTLITKYRLTKDLTVCKCTGKDIYDGSKSSLYKAELILKKLGVEDLDKCFLMPYLEGMKYAYYGQDTETDMELVVPHSMVNEYLEKID